MTILKRTLLISLLSFYHSYGQKNCVTGIVKDTQSEIAFVPLTLTLDSSQTIYTATTDMNGVYQFKQIPKGIYNLTISYLDYSKQTLRNLKVDIQDTLKANFQLEECLWNYELKPCPLCNKKDEVIRVDYNGIQIHYSFENKKKEAAFYKKIKQHGYITVTNHDQEVLWCVEDKQEHEKLMVTNICDKLLFCKRDKKVF